MNATEEFYKEAQEIWAQNGGGMSIVQCSVCEIDIEIGTPNYNHSVVRKGDDGPELICPICQAMRPYGITKPQHWEDLDSLYEADSVLGVMRATYKIIKRELKEKIR